MSHLVTGEAVALEMRLAKLPSRMLAIGIDLCVLAIAAFVAFAAAGAVIPTLDPALAATLSLVTVMAIFVGVPVLVETLTRGRSLGKVVMGLRVVRDDGGPIRFRHALARGLAGVFVDFYVTLGVGAVVCSLLSERGKRVGDWIAGTVVIRERAPAAARPLPPIPPQLMSWAAGLELSRLPDELALAARRYLARSQELSPRVRDEMGNRLATEVAQYVTPAAPTGTPAWAYLTAVLAERGRREAHRMGNHERPPYWAASPGPGGRPDPAAGPGPVPPTGPPRPMHDRRAHQDAPAEDVARPAGQVPPEPTRQPGADRPEQHGGFAPPR